MTTRTPAALPKTVPLMIGRYAVIGRAGTGVPNAYRARDPDGALVAVYLFPSDAVAKGKLVDRLASAFEACSTIEHPNVLRVLDFGPEGASGYLATEWVEGTTLARLIEVQTRLPEANVIRFAAQIGQALDHTQNRSLALCRPRTASVLVRNDGLTKLIPFGLPDANPNPLSAASALLKPEFAATLAADYAGVKQVPFAEAMFSLGTLIHEALTGLAWEPTVPLPSGSKRRRPPPRLTGLTDRSERAIRRATDPDPSKRPVTCAEFLKVLRGRPMTAGTPKPDARPAADADNRRGCVRYSLGVGSNCTINTSVFEGATEFESQEVWPLVVQDASATGIGLLLARRCEPGTELAVEVTSGTDRSVWSLPVRVVRVRKDNYGHWMHGCAFVEPLNEPELAALLSHLGKSDAG
jgi:serine/threonine protein kinase